MPSVRLQNARNQRVGIAADRGGKSTESSDKENAHNSTLFSSAPNLHLNYQEISDADKILTANLLDLASQMIPSRLIFLLWPIQMGSKLRASIILLRAYSEPCEHDRRAKDWKFHFPILTSFGATVQSFFSPPPWVPYGVFSPFWWDEAKARDPEMENTSHHTNLIRSSFNSFTPEQRIFSIRWSVSFSVLNTSKWVQSKRGKAGSFLWHSLTFANGSISPPFSR